jgi:hypothetical protein
VRRDDPPPPPPPPPMGPGQKGHGGGPTGKAPGSSWILEIF